MSSNSIFCYCFNWETPSGTLHEPFFIGIYIEAQKTARNSQALMFSGRFTSWEKLGSWPSNLTTRESFLIWSKLWLQVQICTVWIMMSLYLSTVTCIVSFFTFTVATAIHNILIQFIKYSFKRHIRQYVRSSGTANQTLRFRQQPLQLKPRVDKEGRGKGLFD